MLKFKNISLVVFITLFLFFYYFKYPINENVQVFFTLGKYIDDCESNLYFCLKENHELKPIIGKLTYYLFFKATIVFSDWLNKDQFVYFAQAVYSILSIICFYFFSAKINFNDKEKFSFFLFLISGYFFVGKNIFMEYEHLSVPLSLISIYFFSRNKIFFYIISAFILALISGFKGITSSYSIMTVIFCMIYFDFDIKKKITFLIFFFILNFIVFLISIEDLIRAKDIQQLETDSFNYRIILSKIFPIDGFYKYILANSPILFIGILEVLRNLILRFNFFKSNLTFYLLILLSLTVVIFQRGAVYHYYVFFYFYTIFLLLFVDRKDIKKILNRSIFFTIIIYLISNSSLVFNDYIINKNYNLQKIHKEVFESEKKVFEKISSILNNEKQLLYLSDGTPNFYLTQSSYCKNWVALGLARFGKDTKKSRVTESKIKNFNNQYYKLEKQCVENYIGNYILLQKNWIEIDSLSNITKNYFIHSSHKSKYNEFILFKKKKYDNKQYKS